ncbi:MAG: hypothetical protein LBG11_06510 [Bifidobacteriaceae bacterium]|jgi:hypothetical protein|nr:hypothetical protein [Bifidobacteriaceae bacterium]
MSKKNSVQLGAGATASALATRPQLPSVNLLPDYVAKRQAGRAVQILAVVVLAVLVLAIGGGYVGLRIWKGAADDRLAAAESESARLAKQKKKYDEVIQVNEDLEKTTNALMVSEFYSIRWPTLIDQIFSNRPEDSFVSSINLQGMSATEALSSPDNPLAPARIGAVNIVILIPTLQEVSQWVTSFNSIAGLEEGAYTAAIITTLESSDYYTATCSAQVNLIGLVGSELMPDDFRKWLAEARGEVWEAPTETGEGEAG